MPITGYTTQWWKVSGELGLVMRFLRLLMLADVFVRFNSPMRCSNCRLGILFVALGTKTSSCGTKVRVGSKG
jgi:hypothetical protein